MSSTVAMLYTCLLLTLPVLLVSTQVLTNTFTLGSETDFQTRVDMGCARLSGANMTASRCAMGCLNGCYGVSLDAAKRCYLHTPCVLPPFWAVSGTFSMYKKDNPCLNNSTWDLTNDTCQCLGGFVGKRCHRYARSCKELLAYGYAFKLHRLTLQVSSNLPPFFTICNLVSLTSQLTYVMLNTGTYTGNWTWNEYARGFKVDGSNFWVGLNNMKAISDSGLTDVGVATVITASKGGNESTYSYRYQNFSLSLEAGNFRFSFSNSTQVNTSAKYGDCLLPVNGSEFSTWDADHDQDVTVNSASQAGAGWWFKTPGVGCNPTASRLSWYMLGLNLSNAYSAHTSMFFRST